VDGRDERRTWPRAGWSACWADLRAFNRVFKRSSQAYGQGVTVAWVTRTRGLAFYALLLGWTRLLFWRVPSGL